MSSNPETEARNASGGVAAVATVIAVAVIVATFFLGAWAAAVGILVLALVVVVAPMDWRTGASVALGGTLAAAGLIGLQLVAAGGSRSLQLEIPFASFVPGYAGLALVAAALAGALSVIGALLQRRSRRPAEIAPAGLAVVPALAVALAVLLPAVTGTSQTGGPAAGRQGVTVTALSGRAVSGFPYRHRIGAHCGLSAEAVDFDGRMWGLAPASVAYASLRSDRLDGYLMLVSHDQLVFLADTGRAFEFTSRGDSVTYRFSCN